jgi:hypothetical protein
MARRYDLGQVAQMLGQDPYVVYYLTTVGALPPPGCAHFFSRRQEDDDGLYSEADVGMIKRHANGGLCPPKCSGLGRRHNRAMPPPDVEDPRQRGQLRLRLRTPEDEQ